MSSVHKVHGNDCAINYFDNPKDTFKTEMTLVQNAS